MSDEYAGMPEPEIRERIVEKVESMPQKPRSLIRRPSDSYRENHERIFGDYTVRNRPNLGMIPPRQNKIRGRDGFDAGKNPKGSPADGGSTPPASTNIGRRIEKLREEIDYHNYKYYKEFVPVISDYEFDILMKELEHLEGEHPEYYDSDSPTQRIGE